MKSKGIGLFDSGLGGLTVMKQILSVLPQENVVYFGDTARLPYGGKSPDTIIRYSLENAAFLIDQDIKILVVACNTASSYAIKPLQGRLSIPVIGVIEPGAEKAVSVTRNGRIAVLGTKATTASGMYQKHIMARLPNATVKSVACPLFVPLAEEKFLEHPAAKLIVKEYLAPLKSDNIDTILLGCTHYPLLEQLIREEVGEGVAIVDSASTCAEKVRELLELENLAADFHQIPIHRYFVSDDAERFRCMGSDFLGHPIEHVALNLECGDLSPHSKFGEYFYSSN